ncbi:AzlD domain-containing protein [Bacillus atrophaeus]|uniref:AzlD domain-containing protein n=1 Tax=Bacillus atrophaeus TaxID=1452 RepID=UPI0022808F7C|nr:AzlD domain-containing protein [Bacillus atrophaeus]MCY8914949.1 AzlD domain-containing protein [Bacillus atrophaeus]MCY9116206.1 AzlD domain-containing protein [Bacillus atrophaeus]MEC0926460.1 AzlD domain-containing protein [Bacillus atrophaeus]MEC0933702.1 AzlD domain-containing protein [Bacillus atrophaeus]
MSMSLPMFWLILGCAIVTVIPRIVPFIFVRSVQLPEVVLKWLSYIPICILTALVAENILIETENAVALDWTVLLAMLPTLLIALWTKSLSATVIIGVISMAFIRLFL